MFEPIFNPDASCPSTGIGIEFLCVSRGESEVEEHSPLVGRGVGATAVQHSAVKYGYISFLQTGNHCGCHGNKLFLLSNACIENVVRHLRVRLG